MISELVGLPISNVSMYDASTAAAEAITCAVRVNNRKATKKDVVFVSSLVPPHRMSVIRNYTEGAGIEIRTFEHDDSGKVSLNSLASASGCCAVYVEQPNSLGIVDTGLLEIKSIIGEDTSLIVGIDAVSLGIIEPPGKWGADIVVGEGQPFGIGPTFGGPIYGIFACSENYLRQMPGRIVGQSWDSDGKLAFTLTLSTREQHIRRHRATSNICSNETLIALMGAIHMSLLGPEGLERLSLRIAAATESTRRAITRIDSVELAYPDSSHFRELAIRVPGKASNALQYLDSIGVIGGLDLGTWWDGMSDCILLGVDERTSESDIEELTSGLSRWSEGR